MAITFPLARSAFADRLKIAAFRWQLAALRRDQRHRPRPGHHQRDRPAPLARRGRARPHAARRGRRHPGADRRDRTLRHLLPAQPGPARAARRSHRAAVAGHAVAINATSDNKALQLSGLPAGYTLRRGDMLHFDYGPSPTRRALHRIVEDATASSGGTTGFFEVRPFLKAGTATGAAVTLVRAAARMMLEPGLVRSRHRGAGQHRGHVLQRHRGPLMRAVDPAAQALREARGGLAERIMVWIAARNRLTDDDRGARALVRRGQRDDHRHRPVDRGAGDAGLPRRRLDCSASPRSSTRPGSRCGRCGSRSRR